MNLIEKLPHKAPALLIDAVTSIDASGATCAMLRAPHPSLTRNGLLPAPLGIEAMAQAAAVWMIWNYPSDPGEGMLVLCRDFEMKTRMLDVSAGLRAVAHPVSVGSPTGLFLFKGEILNDDAVPLASASFMIHIGKSPA